MGLGYLDETMQFRVSADSRLGSVRLVIGSERV